MSFNCSLCHKRNVHHGDYCEDCGCRFGTRPDGQLQEKLSDVFRSLRNEIFWLQNGRREDESILATLNAGQRERNHLTAENERLEQEVQRLRRENDRLHGLCVEHVVSLTVYRRGAK